MTATSTGEVFGTITVEGLGASIIVLDKTLFLKGAPEFWAAMAARFGVTSGDGTALGNRWVKLPTVLLGVEFTDVFTPDVVAQTAGKAAKNADKELTTKTTTVGAVAALEVPVDGGTVYLAKDAPHGVVSIALDEIGSAENTKAKDVSVSVTDASANDQQDLHRPRRGWRRTSWASRSTRSPRSRRATTGSTRAARRAARSSWTSPTRRRRPCGCT